MQKTVVHRKGKYSLFSGINTRQLSLGIWIDRNCLAIDLGIIWFSIAWN